MKKQLLIYLTIIILTSLTTFLITKKETKTNLPKPEITDGLRGTFGIDKNINEKTIDNYLNRTDTVYRDMRMLKDPGKSEPPS